MPSSGAVISDSRAMLSVADRIVFARSTSTRACSVCQRLKPSRTSARRSRLAWSAASARSSSVVARSRSRGVPTFFESSCCWRWSSRFASSTAAVRSVTSACAAATLGLAAATGEVAQPGLCRLDAAAIALDGDGRLAEIEVHQHVALLHAIALADGHRHDAAGHLRGQVDRLRLDAPVEHERGLGRRLAAGRRDGDERRQHAGVHEDAWAERGTGVVSHDRGPQCCEWGAGVSSTMPRSPSSVPVARR